MFTVVFDMTCVNTPRENSFYHLHEVNNLENLHENGVNGKDLNKITIGTGVEFGSYNLKLWFD